jgi:cytochrome c556
MKTIIRTLALGAFVLGAGTVDGQTPRTGRLMREKLTHAQKVLEALTTSNQELLLSESAALERITHSPRWDELRMTELQNYTDAFLKAVHEPNAAAGRREFEAAATEYGDMTMACVRCHRRLKDMRIAR